MDTTIALLAGLVVGAAAGALCGWLLGVSRARAALQQAQQLAASSSSTLSEVRGQAAALHEQAARLREALEAEQCARVAAQTRLDESQRNLEQQRQLLVDAELRLREAFAALSSDALRKNSEEFARQTEQRVKPLSDALQRYEKQIQELEQARQNAYGRLTQALEDVGKASQQLRQETSQLVTALRAPQVRGRWGEITLRRTVEAAGLSSHCDFSEQVSVDGDSGRQRPDLVVHLPGRRTIVVDAKVPLQGFLDALEASDEPSRQQCLQRHAGAIRTHMKSLSAKAYWSQFDPSPDFVVLFIPGESFFSAALERDRTLIEDGIAARVILATPTTLIALLRTVAYAWQQSDLVENARQIGGVAAELYERVGKFAEHFSRVGDHLRKATESFNDASGSWERRVLPLGRRIAELGVATRTTEFPELPTIDAAPRRLASNSPTE